MISSLAMPATGEPRNGRGLSPHASSVVRPTPSSRSQIAGTLSISIQWYWMLLRSVMSAVLRAYAVDNSPSARRALPSSTWPSVRIRIMK